MRRRLGIGGDVPYMAGLVGECRCQKKKKKLENVIEDCNCIVSTNWVHEQSPFVGNLDDQQLTLAFSSCTLLVKAAGEYSTQRKLFVCFQKHHLLLPQTVLMLLRQSYKFLLLLHRLRSSTISDIAIPI